MVAPAGASDQTARYLVDSQGNRVAVLLDIDTYHQMLSALEEIEAIKAYDAARAAQDEVVSFEEAVIEIERGRRDAERRAK